MATQTEGIRVFGNHYLFAAIFSYLPLADFYSSSKVARIWMVNRHFVLTWHIHLPFHHSLQTLLERLKPNPSHVKDLLTNLPATSRDDIKLRITKYFMTLPKDQLNSLITTVERHQARPRGSLRNIITCSRLCKQIFQSGNLPNDQLGMIYDLMRLKEFRLARAVIDEVNFPAPHHHAALAFYHFRRTENKESFKEAAQIEKIDKDVNLFDLIDSYISAGHLVEAEALIDKTERKDCLLNELAVAYVKGHNLKKGCQIADSISIEGRKRDAFSSIFALVVKGKEFDLAMDLMGRANPVTVLSTIENFARVYPNQMLQLILVLLADNQDLYAVATGFVTTAFYMIGSGFLEANELEKAAAILPKIPHEETRNFFADEISRAQEQVNEKT